ncbi:MULTISPECIES: ParA family protein [Methylobacterium]|uniref:CobQ/CobB/MinD/ParA nucleotide binding domain-containing protein n=1 Tax=Methylobacterium isbiliense TaxID=315478 RepID=A0ABQ4SKL9_9HYPH|nr:MULTISPECIES: ParA family protein [Methylobacterium]MBY0298524.1 ParA family protein [Methylobacterium sp.]MDN3627631.1 ParA family protein [Methylobacterium isbiliense]GJE02211.1 hypothetical protein GMJLKIPL_4155 [Methylobacterium isbiliense]
MHVLTIAAQKGGSGKTTLAASLAVAAAQAGEIVVGIDIDRQGSLSAWGSRRLQTRTDITFRPVEAAGLLALIDRIRAHGRATLCIVDTPGVFGDEVITALQAATLCLLPVRPSILDVDATRRTAQALHDLNQRHAFVLTQVQAASLGRARDAAEALVELGEVSPQVIGLRTDHLDAVLLGQGVTEWRPSGAAAKEISSLWDWLRTEALHTEMTGS